MNEENSQIETKILRIDPKTFKPEELAYPVQLIQEGEVVAFPTETVYGLGANALNPEAAKKVRSFVRTIELTRFSGFHSAHTISLFLVILR
jgi:hypothetical protein